MKRVWFGAGLLILLLLAGIASSRWMQTRHTPLSGMVSQAAQAALAEQWDSADRLTRQAETAWKSQRKVAAVFSDHSPMEEIDALFAQLSIFSQARESTAFASACACLAEKLEAIADAHSLRWWNLL